MLLGALLIIAIGILFGFSLVSYCDIFSSFMSRLALAIPLGVASISFVELAAYAALGSITQSSIFLALGVLLVASFALFLHSKKPLKRFFIGERILFDMPISAQVAVLAVSIIISIVFASSIFMQNGTMYCVDAGCSDISYHMGVGIALLNSAFPPKYPFSIATVDAYPFINDLFSALLLKEGFGVVQAVVVPDIALVFSLISLSMLIAYRLLKNSSAAISALLMFWFGGNGIMLFLEYPFRAQLTPIFQPAHLLYVNGATAGILGILNTLYYTSSEFITYWVPVLNMMLIAQRDLLLGLPIALLVILLLYEFTLGDRGKRKKSMRLPVLAGLATGMLPLVNPPALIAIAAFGATVFAYSLVRKKREAMIGLVAALLVAVIIAVPQLIFLNSQSRAPNFSGFEALFLISSPNPLLQFAYTLAYALFFWTVVLGVVFIIGIVGLIKAKSKLRIFAAPFLALIPLVMVYRFLPDPADANKIVLYAFLALCLLSGYLLSVLWSGDRWHKAAAAVLLLLVVFNYPFIFVWHDVGNAQLLYSSGQLNATAYIMNHTAPNSIFAVSDYSDFKQPVSGLAGRQTLISVSTYASGIYTYTPEELEAANNAIFSQGNCSVIREFNVSYVYLLARGANNESVFNNSNFTLLYDSYDSQLGERIDIFKTECD